MNISHLHRGICQLEKLRASEKQCPPAFAVCKLELGGKAIVLQTRFRRTRFSRSQQRTKRKEKKTFHKTKKPRRKCLSVVSRRHSFRTMKNPTMKNNRACSKKLLSHNIAFFCFLRSHYFFVTDCWYIQRWSTSCFSFWELIGPRDLVTFGENFAFYQ